MNGRISHPILAKHSLRPCRSSELAVRKLLRPRPERKIALALQFNNDRFKWLVAEVLRQVFVRWKANYLPSLPPCAHAD